MTFGNENDHVNESSADAYLGTRPDLLKDEESQGGHGGAMEMTNRESKDFSGTTHTMMSNAGALGGGGGGAGYPYSSVDVNGSQQWSSVGPGVGGSPNANADPNSAANAYANYYNQIPQAQAAAAAPHQYYDNPSGYGNVVPAGFAAHLAHSNSHSSNSGYANQRPASGNYESAYGGLGGNSSNGHHQPPPLPNQNQRGTSPPGILNSEGQWYAQGQAPIVNGNGMGDGQEHLQSSPILLPHMGNGSPQSLSNQLPTTQHSSPTLPAGINSTPTSAQRPNHQMNHAESYDSLPETGRLPGGGLHLVNPDE